MPFNGSGGFDPLPPPIYPAIDGTTIESAQYNDSLDDIFGGLGNCVTRDGQSPATADLPMGANTIVGARAAVIAGEPLIFGQSGAELVDLTLSGAFSAASGTIAGSPILTAASPGAYLPLTGGTLSGALIGTTFTGTSFSGDGSALTALNATQLTSGTVPDARFPATLPALSGVNLTALNASNLASGTVPTARITSVSSGTTMDGKVLGYKGLPAASVTTGAFVAADAGKCVYATGGVTVPDATMAAEDTVVIQNTTASPITITATITTLRWTTTGGTGNRTLAAYGRASIVFGSRSAGVYRRGSDVSGVFAGLIPHGSSGGLPPTGAFNGANVEYERNGATATAAGQFNTDGTCSGAGVSTLVTDTLTGTNWYPGAPSVGIGSSYWFLFTHFSGNALASNDAVVWTQGTSQLSFSLALGAPGSQSAFVQVDIALSSGGPVISTGLVELNIPRL